LLVLIVIVSHTTNELKDNKDKGIHLKVVGFMNLPFKEYKKSELE
jgi:hypothetical protein